MKRIAAVGTGFSLLRGMIEVNDEQYDRAVRGPVDGVVVGADAYAPCEGASVLVVLTEWDEFRWADLEKVHGLMASPTTASGGPSCRT